MQVLIGGKPKQFRSVSYDRGRNAVVLIDQRLLPHRFELVRTRSYTETAEAIRQMVVRGAPAIAAAAAYGLVQGAMEFDGARLSTFRAHVRRVFNVLKNARPTAVDPVNAMNFVLGRIARAASVSEAQAAALAAATEFAERSVAECRAIGEHGLKLIRPGMRIMTHCNAGWLACVDIGTVTAPIYAAHAAGVKLHVWCSETRPRCQGSSLTAWELAQMRVPHTVIADNAAGLLMATGQVDMVLVGSDRVLGRTGEITNKIGTYMKAVLAHRHGVPFYVAAPLSTIDWTLTSGAQVPIEERDEAEVLGATGVPARPGRVPKPKRGSTPEYVLIANPGSRAFNPGFDITPPELITGIITPVGIFKPAELWARRAELGCTQC